MEKMIMILRELQEVNKRVQKSQFSRRDAIMSDAVKDHADTVMTNLALSKAELANALNVSRPTLNQAIQTLQANNTLDDILRSGNRFLLTLNHCHIIAEHLKIPSWKDVVGTKHIIPVANLKGGTGKSTVTVNIASALAVSLTERKRILLIDLDPQGSARTTSQPDMEKTQDILTAVDLMLSEYEMDKGYNSYNEYIGDVSHTDIVKYSCQPTQYPNLKIMASFPSDERFNEFAYQHFKDDPMQATKLLKERVIDHVIDDFDIIFIDVSPALNPLVWCAMEAATGLIVPVTPRQLDWMATGTFFEHLPERLSRLPSKGENINWFKVLLNNVETEHNRDSAMVAEIQNSIGATDMFMKAIDRSAAFEAATRYFRTVMDIRPKDDLVTSNQLNSAKTSLSGVSRELISILKAKNGVD
jgi:cellulose biosynthesis protein BcsQ